MCSLAAGAAKLLQDPVTLCSRCPASANAAREQRRSCSPPPGCGWWNGCGHRLGCGHWQDPRDRAA